MPINYLYKSASFPSRIIFFDKPTKTIAHQPLRMPTLDNQNPNCKKQLYIYKFKSFLSYNHIYMNKALLLALLLVYGTLALRMHRDEDAANAEPEEIAEEDEVLGSWHTEPLEEVDPEVVDFVKEKYPRLKDAKLVAVKTQVVAGINYRLTFENSDNVQYRVTVWYKPWMGSKKIVAYKKLHAVPPAAPPA